MRFTTRIIAAALTVACGGAAYGASPEEAKQLGTTLTAVGAEKAGNKEGTIPAYTGGLTTPPASYQKGGKVRTDPFADEKPRLVITRQGRRRACGQAHRGDEGAAEALSDDAARRLSDAPHRRRSAAQFSTTR